MCCSEASGAGPDDCDPFWFCARYDLYRFTTICQGIIHNKTLQGHNADRLIHQRSGTMSLTGVMTGSATDAGKGIVFLYHSKGFPIASLSDESDVALCSLSCGAGGSAGGDTQFLNCVSIGNGLWIEDVSRFLCGKAFVERLRYLNGTNLSTITATDTCIDVDVSRFSTELNLEVTGVALEVQYLSIQEEIDIKISTDIDKLRAECTHGTVIGWEGFIELGHMSTDR
jgi:hypothetical protein